MNQQNPKTSDSAQDPGRRRILIADDDPDMSVLLKRALQNAEMSVHLVNSGQAALAIFQKNRESADFEFFLTDRNLPDISGEDLFRFFRAAPGRGHIPVALMSADLDAATRNRFFAMGFTEVFQKPFDPAKIADRIDAILNLLSSIETGDTSVEWSSGGTIDANHIVDSELRTEYLSGLTTRIRAIEDASEAIAGGRPDALENLKTEAHRIAGTAAMFGVPELEAPASKIESTAEKLTDENRVPTETEREDLATAIRLLNKLVRKQAT